MMELFSSAGLNTRGLTADRCLDLNVSNNYNGARVTTSKLPRLNASTDLIQTTISIQWLHTHLESKNSIAAIVFARVIMHLLSDGQTQK